MTTSLNYKLVLPALILMFFGPLMSQTAAGVDPKYAEYEEYPRFPGCDAGATVEEKEECAEVKLLQFVYSNLKYPDADRAAKKQGMVKARFIVTASGDLKDAKIEETISDACSQEVLRLIGMMPKWVPGKNGGKPTDVEYIISVKFTL